MCPVLERLLCAGPWTLRGPRCVSGLLLAQGSLLHSRFSAHAENVTQGREKGQLEVALLPHILGQLR